MGKGCSGLKQTTICVSKSAGSFFFSVTRSGITYVAPNDQDQSLIFKLFSHINRLLKFLANRGWSGGAMVLGKLPVPRRPTI